MILISLSEAENKGLKRYFTGKPCKNGHVCERVTISRICVDCAAINSKNSRERNLDNRLAKEQSNRENRREYNLNYSRERYKNNKEKVRQASEKWRLLNLDKSAAFTAKRKAALLQACPPWVNLKDIEVFYKRARELTLSTGTEHEVDHIHPLQGENICGLHVPWNLQILTKSENCSKKNKFIQIALKE